MNPFGSNKDRIAKWILQEANKCGAFQNQRKVIEASSGSTAISLSSIAHIMGLEPIIYLPNDIA
jgi:cysteine synthase